LQQYEVHVVRNIYTALLYLFGNVLAISKGALATIVNKYQATEWKHGNIYQKLDIENYIIMKIIN